MKKAEKKTENKEKLKPKRCVCGSEAIIVKSKGEKMISCPDPMNRRANLRSMWKSSEDAAIVEWNGIVDSFYSEHQGKGGES